MSNLTPEQRIDQLERLLATLVRVVQGNSQSIADNTRAIADNTRAIADLAERIEENRLVTLDNSLAISRLSENMQQMNDLFTASLRIMQEMQTQVRGLQIENQRIIGRVFGEDNPQ